MLHEHPTVDAQGFIVFAGERLSQADAVDLAFRLVTAVRQSTDRNQIGTASYNDTENIIRRAESPIGRALHALSRVYGL